MTNLLLKDMYHTESTVFKTDSPIRSDSKKEEPSEFLFQPMKNIFQPIKHHAESIHNITTSYDIIDTASTDTASTLEINEALINKKRIDELHLKYTQQLLRLITEDNFEYGFSSQSEFFIEPLMKINPSITREWLNELFIKNFHDHKIIAGLLHVISHLEYDQIRPQGITMAIAALSHISSEIRECGIRAFENWGSSECLNLLKNVRCNEGWLQQYVNQVISDIEEKLGGNISAC